MSFDTAKTRASNLEVHGETGSLTVPDPNHFTRDVALFRLGGSEWEVLGVSAGYRDAGRGYGVADLARTPSGASPRAGGDLGFHVLVVMESLLLAAAEGHALPVTSTVERPSPVPLQSLNVVPTSIP